VTKSETRATLHLMVGLPCSGKSTLARRLAEEHNALLLTTDAWHIRLFGDDAIDPLHDERHSIIEAIEWDVAERVLTLGCDVILDFGFWNRAERLELRERARALGVGFRLHYMDVPTDELYRRLRKRNREAPPGSFTIPESMMDKFIPVFEPPSLDEFAVRYAN